MTIDAEKTDEEVVEVSNETELSERDKIAEKAKRLRQEEDQPDDLDDQEEDQPDNVDDDQAVETMLINDEETKIPVSELIEAGKKAKSLEQSSYTRFQDAAAMKRKAEDLQRYYEMKLKEIPDEQSTTQDEEPDDSDLDEQAKKLTDAMLYGESEEEIKAFFRESLKSMHDKPEQSDLSETRVDEIINNRLQEQHYNAEVNRANEVFSEKYPDIASDQALYQLANQETIIIQAENPEMAPSDIILEAGERVMKRFGSVVERAQSNREQRKSEMAPVVTGQNVRVPAQPKSKPVSRSDVVSQLRKQRGQMV